MIKCDVIQDLLPLYQDKVASAESASLIEEHIKHCPNCRAYFDALQASDMYVRVEVDDAEIGALRKMKKKLRKKSLVMILAGALLTLVLIVASVALFGSRFPISFLLGSEKIGAHEMAAMRESRLLMDASTILAINDEKGNHTGEIRFPLPNGAVPFENSAYPVSEGNRQYLITSESFEPYLSEILPQNGFHYDRMGAWIAVYNIDNSIRIGMSSSMFTGDYMRLQIWEITTIPNVP